MAGPQHAELVKAALEVRKRAYADYSDYLVGAALLADDGKIYVGCNVENISYGLTICAERFAAGSAIAAGNQQFKAIAIATENAGTPCGACRQFLAEFTIKKGGDLDVVLVNAKTHETKKFKLSKLLPNSFDLPAAKSATAKSRQRKPS